MLSTTEESYHPRRTLESTASLCPPIRRNLSVSSAPQGASRDGGTRDFEAAPSRLLRDPPEGPVDYLRERGGWGRVRLPDDLHHRVLPADWDRIGDDRPDPRRRGRGDGDLCRPPGHLLRPPRTEGPALSCLRGPPTHRPGLRLHDGTPVARPGCRRGGRRGGRVPRHVERDHRGPDDHRAAERGLC